MTKLQKLILKNFKSFKKAEIPISNGFTVIAPENGVTFEGSASLVT